MIVQISSGQGPCECEIAVRLLFESLEKEFSSDSQKFSVISKSESKWCSGFSSIIFRTEKDISFLEGSVEWQCKSFLRPNHKRKNWFIDVAVLPDLEEISGDGKIRWQFFRSGGNGGQNVNKVETGVRLIHVQTGISVTCTEERSQSMNRKRAMEKLKKLLEDATHSAADETKCELWAHHKKLVRGQAVRVYVGKDFVLKES